MGAAASGESVPGNPLPRRRGRIFVIYVIYVIAVSIAATAAVAGPVRERNVGVILMAAAVWFAVPLYAVARMARFSQEREESARRDILTGLPNRNGLRAEITDRVSRASRAGIGEAEGLLPAVLLLLDLDRFRRVNEALGHAVGDRLLIEVARRLAACVRPGDVVARLGGDEFAILAHGPDDVPSAYPLADRVAWYLEEPVVLAGVPLDMNASIGIVVCPTHGTDADTLLGRAEIAMYDAKNRGLPYAVYCPEADRSTPERLELLADLRQALLSRSTDISFYYQPQVNIDSGVVVGVEALLRWHHPVRGMIDPQELIETAERTAIMRLLSRRVIEDAVAQLARWRGHGLAFRASVNISVRDLHSGELAELLAKLLAAHRVPANQIQLEITESAAATDPHRMLVTMHQLDRLGVALSLDDFGTGYSSLQHLRRMPLSEVKVDRSFILGMGADPDDRAIVRSIIELSGVLGLRVVAEGVEDDATRRMLAEYGCEIAQGWFYARPMPADELASWISRYRPAPARQCWRRDADPNEAPPEPDK